MYRINRFLSAERLPDGTVKIYHHDAREESEFRKGEEIALASLTPHQWASLFVAMSADDSSGEIHEIAL